MLVRRFREDRLGLTAGSLTFTTLISLVPLFTVGLAVFTAFPMFANFQKALERFLFQNLVPESIARPVMSGVSRFAGQASQLGTLGFVLLILAALALLMTIDRSLNDLWRVRRRRSWTRRVLLYWTLLTLGPLVLGAILALTSWAVSASRGWVGALPGGLSWVVETIQFLLVAGGAAALFHGVPNAPVRWSHAAAGGVFVALGTEVAKAGLGWYLTAVPGLRSIYGAFAVVPIVLLWVYLMWVVVLLGAVVAAYAPALRQPPSARVRGPGRRFEGAISVLSALKEARSQPARGIAEADLTRLLPLDPVDIEAVLQALIDLGWVGRLEDAVSDPPYVLLVDPSAEPAAALMDALLLAPSAVTATFRQAASFETLSLADLLVGQGPQSLEEADGAKPRRSASSTPSGASAIRS
jgi:membrane protein